jgi:hypothetical protein
MSLIISPVCNLTLQLKGFKLVDPPDVWATKNFITGNMLCVVWLWQTSLCIDSPIGRVLLEDIVKAGGIVSRYNPLYKNS